MQSVCGMWRNVELWRLEADLLICVVKSVTSLATRNDTSIDVRLGPWSLSGKMQRRKVCAHLWCSRTRNDGGNIVFFWFSKCSSDQLHNRAVVLLLFSCCALSTSTIPVLVRQYLSAASELLYSSTAVLPFLRLIYPTTAAPQRTFTR